MNEDFNTTLAAEWEEYAADLKSRGADWSEGQWAIFKKIYYAGAVGGAQAFCGIIKQSPMDPAEQLIVIACAQKIFTEAHAQNIK